MSTQVLLLFLAGLPSNDPYESALIAAIHHFAREGSRDHLNAILDKHPNLVDAQQRFPEGHKPHAAEGYTPLDWAAVGGHVEVADDLIRRGAKINAADGAGWTPLLLAARDGRLDIVKLLVKHGADVDAKTEAIPETSSDSLPGAPAAREPKPAVKYPAIPSRTALDWAAAMKHTEVVAYLKSLKK